MLATVFDLHSSIVHLNFFRYSKCGVVQLGWSCNDRFWQVQASGFVGVIREFVFQAHVFTCYGDSEQRYLRSHYLLRLPC